VGESASCKKMKEGRKGGSMSGVGRGRGRRGRWTNRENLPPSTPEPGNVTVRVPVVFKFVLDMTQFYRRLSDPDLTLNSEQ
jgi:hypothetical protein